MTPKEIVEKFAHNLDNFKPIYGQPSDTNLTRLWEAVAPLLLQIPYDETGSVHNLISLIRAEAAYVSRYGEVFPEPIRVGAYNSNIDKTTIRPSSVRDPKRPTRQSAPIVLLSKRRDGRRQNSYSPSLPTPVSVNYWTVTPFTLRSHQSNYFHTSKRGAPSDTPSSSWRCITKCSATTSWARESPSISTCSRSPNGKPAGREER